MCYRDVLYVLYGARYKYKFTQFVQAVSNTFRPIVVRSRKDIHDHILQVFSHLLFYVLQLICLFLPPIFSKDHTINPRILELLFCFAFSSRMKWTADFYQVTNITFSFVQEKTISDQLHIEVVSVCIGMTYTDFIFLYLRLTVKAKVFYGRNLVM